ARKTTTSANVVRLGELTGKGVRISAKPWRRTGRSCAAPKPNAPGRAWLRLTSQRSVAQHRRHDELPGRRSAHRCLAPEAHVTRAERRVASPRVVAVDDLRPLARRRVPPAVFGYIAGGPDSGRALPENPRA